MPKILSDEEKVVLIGICRYIINSDGVVTESELAAINQIAEEIGFENYQKTFDEADRLITSVELLHEKIDNLKKSSNNRKILQYAIQLSRCDALIKNEEIDIIVYAADSWDFDIKSFMK
jgi:tellurite resistance protein